MATYEDEYLELYNTAKAAEAEVACKCPEHDRPYPNDLCAVNCATHRAALAASDAIAAQFGRDVITLQKRNPSTVLNPEF